MIPNLNFVTRKIVAVLIVIYSTFYWALAGAVVTELSGGYNYYKRKYGSNRENLYVEKGQTAALAFYFLTSTAFEFTYSQQKDVNTNNEVVNNAGVYGLSIIQMETTVNTEIVGAGLKQLLAPRTSLLSPMIGLGYVKQTIRGKRLINYRYDGIDFPVSDEDPKVKRDRAMGTFMLKFNLSAAFSINFSVRTIFKAFEWSEAGDDLRYEGGLSWYL